MLNLRELAWQAFSFAYGLLSFSLMAIGALRDGAFTTKRSMSKEEETELELAQKKYWQLSEEPLPGFQHKFYMLRSGINLHYVVNSDIIEAGAKEGKSVVIFIHGFPDSYLLWRNLLTSPDLSKYILIAVDLPGYGGSDSLEKYDAETVLEVMTGFILGMRKLYLSEDAKLVMVTHDWGSIIGARLASEAKELADRWIITAGVIPQHVLSNARTHLASSQQMLHTYLQHPFRPSNFRLLKRALSNLSPILSQLRRSFYIFIFTLPHPLSPFFIRMGNYWFLRLIQRLEGNLNLHAHEPSPSSPSSPSLQALDSKTKSSSKPTLHPLSPAASADAFAACSGPGYDQCHISHTPATRPLGAWGAADIPLQYTTSVNARIATHHSNEKIRYYREGFLGPWEKSIETVVALSELPVSKSSGAAGSGILFDDSPPGALKAPATIIYGRNDLAFDARLALEGIGDFLARGSQVLVVREGGHWLPCEKVGWRVIEDVVLWALDYDRKERDGKIPGGSEYVTRLARHGRDGRGDVWGQVQCVVDKR